MSQPDHNPYEERNLYTLKWRRAAKIGHVLVCSEVRKQRIRGVRTDFFRRLKDQCDVYKLPANDQIPVWSSHPFLALSDSHEEGHPAKSSALRQLLIDDTISLAGSEREPCGCPETRGCWPLLLPTTPTAGRCGEDSRDMFGYSYE